MIPTLPSCPELVIVLSLAIGFAAASKDVAGFSLGGETSDV
jgi:hypothetical protein